MTGKDFGRDSGLSPYVPAVEEGQSVSVSTDALWENVLAALAREADTHQQWVDACAALTTLRERFEAARELALQADGLTQIGHGLILDEPVNAGSLAWATAAFKFLETLATDTKERM